MLAKVIASAESRDAAIARAAAALRAFPILGVRTNLAFLVSVLDHPAFRAGILHTGFVDEHLAALLEKPQPSDAVLAAAAFARAVPADARPGLATRVADPWTDLRGWGR
jgi:acetyl/propionyl-CoA carboxylase alpha subunit